jgi:crotonobetainyl-CoA:carnitine CoA-transferase CaiB-like acyl-CoA transferase
MAPHKSAIAYGDPNAGAIAAASALAALMHRERTGEGQHIEVAQWEAMIGNVGEFLLAYQMLGQVEAAIGNRHVSRVQGVYRCAGEDMWVAISVGSDAEFASLCEVLGRPELAHDARFADVVSRRRNQDELDGIVREWTAQHTQQDAARILQDGGVAAAPVLRIQELMEDENLRALGFWESVTHAEAGTWDMEGPTWRMSDTPTHVRMPAPMFGEHNPYVFGELLGLDEAEIEELYESGVAARVPDLGLHG